MITNEKQRLLSYIGLARKAGKLICGTDMVCDAIRDGKIKLVVVSDSVSANTQKRITNCAKYYNVTLKTAEGITPAELGAALGKSDMACVGVTDSGFCELILGISSRK
ncbi:MAG: ribosomal L7Ae/L30e/S12e/Gadd45 family protein [Clostridia bacterium]|nr:ribosomal L7Ae/L30e/S12e/Gadd45 family protein [Clostridia bacterium]